MKDLLLRFGSRKLLVFVVGSIFLFSGYLNQDNWLILALAYAGLQTFLDSKKEKKEG